MVLKDYNPGGKDSHHDHEMIEGFVPAGAMDCDQIAASDYKDSGVSRTR